MRDAQKTLLWVSLAVALLGACAADLQPGVYACDPAAANTCPAGWVCECHGARCNWLCYDRATGTCGDDVLGPGEECDGEAISTQHRCAAGFSYCLDDCTVACTACGDGKAEKTPTGAELCDDGNLLSHDGCSSQCLPEEPQWRELLPRTAFPPPRGSFAMAYDASRGKLVMFGGVDRGRDPSLYRNDTWEWDGRAWLQVSLGSGPSGRSDHAMTYDAARGKVVLFGGAARAGGDPSFWEWDGVRWRRTTATAAPQGILFHRLAYDPQRRRVVYFGGTEGLWAWSYDQRAWLRVDSPGTGPSPRSKHGMVYDPVRGKLVVFGGLSADSMQLADLWEWDSTASTWSQITPTGTSPPPGSVTAMSYDLTRRRIVMLRSLTDVWEWNGADRTWTQIAAAMPEPRSNFVATYFPPSKKLVMFGGDYFNDTWEWDGSSWVSASSLDVTPTGGALHYDPVAARLLTTNNEATSVAIYQWRDQRWSRLSTTGAAPASLLPRDTAFDPRRRRLFGYSSSPHEVWEWGGGNWQRMTTPATALTFSAALYNAGDRKIHVFGGSATIDQAKWDGTQWQLGSLFLGRRIGAGYAYDPTRGRTVLFSGFDGGFTREETWELIGTSWTKRTPPQTPRPTDSAMMTYDPTRRRTVMVAEGRTWEWDGEDWNDITPVTPGPSFPANLAYDATEQAIVASSTAGKVWALRYEHPDSRRETCRFGFDGDSDGLLGCADPDCWAYCSPLCAPGATCVGGDPRCGDGTCDATLESCALCPQDCGACPAVCGDFLCATTESAATCPGDCP